MSELTVRGHRLRACLVLIAVPTALLVGCRESGEAPRDTTTIKGTVSFDGDPLESGVIVLDSADGQSTPAQGTIENGEFEFDAPLGPKIVRINAVRDTGQKDEYGEPITEGFIPARYNSDSELTCTVDINADNVFEFKLEK